MAKKIKPGVKTTEFWLTTITNLVVLGGVLTGHIDIEKVLTATSILNGTYITLRTLAKTPEITTFVENKITEEKECGRRNDY